MGTFKYICAGDVRTWVRRCARLGAGDHLCALGCARVRRSHRCDDMRLWARGGVSSLSVLRACAPVCDGVLCGPVCSGYARVRRRGAPAGCAGGARLFAPVRFPGVVRLWALKLGARRLGALVWAFV